MRNEKGVTDRASSHNLGHSSSCPRSDLQVRASYPSKKLQNSEGAQDSLHLILRGIALISRKARNQMNFEPV